MNDKILITGATGKVGSEVVQLLSLQRVEVIAGARNLEKAKQMNWPGVEIALFDYNNFETIKTAMTKVNKVLWIIPPLEANEVEVSYRAVDYAKQTGIEQIVFISVMQAREAKASPHGFVEKHIEDSGITYTHLRCNFFMQNFNTFYIDAIKKRGIIYVPAGEGKVSFIDVRDIAAAAATVLTSQGYENQVFLLTGGEAIDHYQIAEILSKVSGRKITYPAPSSDKFAAFMKELEKPNDFIELLVLLNYFVSLGWAAEITEDTPRILGRAPITFEQYAHDHAGAWK